MKIEKHPAYKYAIDVVNGDIPSNKYIIKTCQHFLDDLKKQKDDGFKYILDMNNVMLITEVTKLINMASGLKVGATAHDSLVGFQWFFLINALCWKEKSDLEKRRYEKNILLIGRKSGKTFLVALTFILLMLTEPKFSEFYSVAPNLELSGIVKKEMMQLLDASPAINKRFKVFADRIECELKKSKFKNLATSKNRMDGKHKSVSQAFLPSLNRAKTVKISCKRQYRANLLF